MKIFIPSYHRADNLKSVKYLISINWEPSEIFVFIDDEADDRAEYEMQAEKIGFNLVVFSMEEARRRYDYVHRPSKSRRSAGQARNMFQDFAIKNKIDFYCVMADDTQKYTVRYSKGDVIKERESGIIASENEVKDTFKMVELFMRKHNIGMFGLAQSGDLIGGDSSCRLYQNKVMNTTFYLLPFVYRGERGVQDNDTSLFCGVWNEGLFTGSTKRGLVLLQTISATAKGGLTDLYNECKLLNKAMICPIQFPSAIIAERQKKNGNRLHHRINYRYLAPKLLRNENGRSNIAWDTYQEDYPFTNEPKKRN